MRWFCLLLLMIAMACTEAGTDGAKPAAPVAAPVAASVSNATIVSASTVIDSAGADTAAVRFDTAGHPVLPIVLRSHCEGEDCGSHFDAVACLATGLRSTPSDSSAMSVPIAVGESLEVVRRDLRVSSPGVVLVMKDFVLDQEEAEVADGMAMFPRTDTVRLARGDTLYLINYLELGRWTWALHARLHSSGEFWSAAPEGGLGGAGDDSTYAAARSTPTSEDWWLVRTRTGASGWWHGDGHEELQSIFYMQHWADDCDQVRKRS